MRDPNDQRFCTHCGFELDAYGACRECDTDTDIEDDGAPRRDLGGCLPVTAPLGLVAGTIRKAPR